MTSEPPFRHPYWLARAPWFDCRRAPSGRLLGRHTSRDWWMRDTGEKDLRLRMRMIAARLVSSDRDDYAKLVGRYKDWHALDTDGRVRVNDVSACAHRVLSASSPCRNCRGFCGVRLVRPVPRPTAGKPRRRSPAAIRNSYPPGTQGAFLRHLQRRSTQARPTRRTDVGSHLLQSLSLSRAHPH